MRSYRENPLILTFFSNRLPDGVQRFQFSWEDEDANFPWSELDWVPGDWVYKLTDFTGEASTTSVFLWDGQPIGIECERLGELTTFGRDEDGRNWLEF